MNLEKTPLLSACIITYNQDKYIKKCIEGCIKQKVGFDYEIVIGDDNSTDETSNTCQEIQKLHSNLIVYERNDFNLGMIGNWVKTIKRCKGKYIALCEGDDYWTDPLKLQKQVDFLEANSDFAICFHRVKVIYEDSNKKSYFSNPGQKEVTNFEDLANGNYIHTPSCVFRNNLYGKFPDWFFQSPIGDWVLHLLNAQDGKIGFINEVMAVYRIHDNGIWGTHETRKRQSDTVFVAEMCKNHFVPRGEKSFNRFIGILLSDLSFSYFEEANYDEFRKYYQSCLKLKTYIPGRVMRNLHIRYFISHFPMLASSYSKNLKRIKGS